MKILITGASGFIGNHLCKSFSEKHEVYGLTKDAGADLNRDFIISDLLNWGKTEKALLNIDLRKADVIIHLASVLANSENLDDINVLQQNNTLSFNVAKLSKLLNCNILINFSSSSVYPNVTGHFSEASTINPAVNADALYGLSKYNSEVILDKLLLKEKINIVHLRCAMVYGEGVNKSRIWPTMERELKEKNTITVFGNGKRLINQIHIAKLADTIEHIIEGGANGIYNVKEETISMLQLATRIIELKGNANSKIILIEQGNTSEFVLDCEKLRHLQ